jgi:PilZ domain
MDTERRYATRYNFGAIAEVIDLDQSRDLVSLTRDLSVSGVFVKTTTPFPSGTVVRLRITYSGEQFAAMGKISANVTPTGMGIVFTEIEPNDRATLEKWLRQGAG